MILDISSIVTNNTLFNLKQGIPIEEAFEVLKKQSYQIVEGGNNFTILIIGNIEIYFESKIMRFGIAKIYPHNEVMCLEKKINEHTTLDSFQNLLKTFNVPFTGNELLKDNQFDVTLENKAIFSFHHHEAEYYLAKIEWGGKLYV